MLMWRLVAIFLVALPELACAGVSCNQSLQAQAADPNARSGAPGALGRCSSFPAPRMTESVRGNGSSARRLL